MSDTVYFELLKLALKLPLAHTKILVNKDFCSRIASEYLYSKGLGLGNQLELFDEKTRGQKYRDTVPL
jgi:hypothetical protein